MRCVLQASRQPPERCSRQTQAHHVAVLAGKTFLGVQLVRALLHNTATSRHQLLFGERPQPYIGPILVVCYTNHALDSFLESLLDCGCGEGLVRVGGKSRSARLDAYNLSSLGEKAGGKEVYEAYKELDEARGVIERLCDRLEAALKQRCEASSTFGRGCVLLVGRVSGNGWELGAGTAASEPFKCKPPRQAGSRLCPPCASLLCTSYAPNSLTIISGVLRRLRGAGLLLQLQNSFLFELYHAFAAALSAYGVDEEGFQVSRAQRRDPLDEWRDSDPVKDWRAGRLWLDDDQGGRRLSACKNFHRVTSNTVLR